MISLELLLIGAVIVWCLSMIGVAWRIRSRTQWDECKYQLFAVRDRLNILVVEGKLTEDSATYQVGCILINGVLRNIKDMTPKALAQAYVRGDARAREREQLLNRFRRELGENPREVLDVLDEFFMAVGTILKRNSVTLRLFLVVDRRILPLEALMKKTVGEPLLWVAYQRSKESWRLVREAERHAAPSF